MMLCVKNTFLEVALAAPEERVKSRSLSLPARFAPLGQAEAKRGTGIDVSECNADAAPGDHASVMLHNDHSKQCSEDQQAQTIHALHTRLAMAEQSSEEHHAHVQEAHALQIHLHMALATNAYVLANQDEHPAARTNLVAKKELSAPSQGYPADSRTTVMIKNVPELYSHEELLLELNHLVPQDSFDFVFLHMTRRAGRGENRGYAFLNCVSHEAAVQAFAIIMGHVWQKYQGPEILAATVSWAEVQGLKANLKLRRAAECKQMAMKKAKHQGKTRSFTGDAKQQAGNTCKGPKKSICY